MKYLYVTELTFTDNYDMPIKQVVEQYDKESWEEEDIYELLDDMEDEVSYFGRTATMVNASIIDKKALAKWLVGSKLAAYNKATTVIDDDPDVYYNGEHYKFVCLIREVLSDFITSQIENALANPDFEMPSGIELY